MARFTIVRGLTYLDRIGWRARPDLPRLGYPVARDQRTHVIIHHTTITDTDSTTNLWETEREVQQQMQRLQTVRPQLGLDVPYNFVLFLMNQNPPAVFACEGRGEDRTGAHTKGHNTTGIGIAIQGNFQQHIDITRFVPLISFFLGWLKFDPNGPGYGGPYPPLSNLGQLKPAGREVFCHRDFSATHCPGHSVMAILPQIRFANPRPA